MFGWGGGGEGTSGWYASKAAIAALEPAFLAYSKEFAYI